NFVIDGATAQLTCDNNSGTRGPGLFRFEAGTKYLVVEQVEMKNFATAVSGPDSYSQIRNNYIHDYYMTPGCQYNDWITGRTEPDWAVGFYSYSNYTVFHGNVIVNAGREGFQFWYAGQPVQGMVIDGNVFRQNGFTSTGYCGEGLVAGASSGATSPIVI